LRIVVKATLFKIYNQPFQFWPFSLLVKIEIGKNVVHRSEQSTIWIIADVNHKILAIMPAVKAIDIKKK
jgi:hypothetical protein